jgi:hypothetical protein
MIKNIETSNRNRETYSAALAAARIFPSHQQVCKRLADRGINPRMTVVTGHSGEVTQEAGMTFLAAIHDEIGDSELHAIEAEREYRDAQDKAQVEAGPSLTTICNTKEEHISLSDTLENIAAILEKNKGRVFDDALEGDIEEAQPVKPSAPKVILTDYARKLLARKS